MKIVINDYLGGFELSEKALNILKNRGFDEEEIGNFRFGNFRRDYKEVIQVIEELGEEANGLCSDIKVVEIPDDSTDWDIIEYDGSEYVIYVKNGKIEKIF